jgi:hypothetical protein
LTITISHPIGTKKREKRKCLFGNSQKQDAGCTDPRGPGNELTAKFYNVCL